MVKRLSKKRMQAFSKLLNRCTKKFKTHKAQRRCVMKGTKRLSK